MDLITYALLKRQIAECETNIKAFIPHIGENENWYVGDEDTGKPSRGDKGPDGKSAYQYAQDGGYTGTEEEFTAKLAAENIDKALFVVNITQNSDRTFSADKTFEEIVQTYNEGKHNIVANAALKFPRIAPLAAISEHAILFSNSLPNGKNDADLITIGIASNNEVQIEMLPLATKTSKLPNPFPLTFTGAVEGRYDGSEPLNVKIPSGGGAAVETWDLLINAEITEDCTEAIFNSGDAGETLSDYKELLVLIDLFGNTGGFETELKIGFLNAVKAWHSPYYLKMTGYSAETVKYYINMFRFKKTEYGILPVNRYTQYNQGSVSNSLSHASGASSSSGIAPDFTLPISANQHVTTDMTDFTSQKEFERLVIGGYQAIIGAGTIIKVWGMK